MLIFLDFAAVRHFNPRAPRGARLGTRLPPRYSGRYFNPRAPRGARPTAMGSTVTLSFNFNPRAPRGARLYGPEERGVSAFQSTRPARGATLPQSGGDAQQQYFNPRAPRGARLCWACMEKRKANISIHAPREGRDLMLERFGIWVEISIHAPREGRDKYPGWTRENMIYNFNPRAPRGARQSAIYTVQSVILFQSTRPARGATNITGAKNYRLKYFNPRAPRGARPAPQRGSAAPRDFNPRAPRGARRCAMRSF